MHSLLSRQLRRLGLEDGATPPDAATRAGRERFRARLERELVELSR